ncbi:hypothetical protein D4S03_02945 [bacterium]|nr:MAG: hypothetical protein D4S03_02945 [bacterium]
MRRAGITLWAIALLFAALDLALWTAPTFLDNFKLVALIRGAPSLIELSTYWYGTGLLIGQGNQVREIGQSYYRYSPEANLCSTWETQALRSLPTWRLPGLTESAKTVQTLLLARQAECAMHVPEALDILASAPESDRVDAERVRLLRRLGRDEQAIPLALKLICPGHPDWCRGYLLDQWYGKDPGMSNQLLQLESHVNVTLQTESVPTIITGITPGQNDYDGNYLGYDTYAGTGSPARMRIKGEIVDSTSAGCLSARFIYYDSVGNYFGEVSQSYTVSGQFQIDYTAPPPGETGYIWPQITFEVPCFAAGQKVVIYNVWQVSEP